jgi:methylglutaconyl-CoA hydratase
MSYQYIHTEQEGPVARLWLHRPEVRNALHRGMIREITGFLQSIKNDPGIRILVLGGNGNAFCAGADMNWMREAAGLSSTENRQDAMELARCLKELALLPKITIARVHGSAYGGAIGLMAACDLAVISKSCRLAFSEVRLGLIPATIAPYVMRKAHPGIHELLLTGKEFDGTAAATLHLATRAVPEDDLDATVNVLVQELLLAAPEAQLKIKKLISQFSREIPDDSMVFQTATWLAETRISPEAREGLAAFSEKRTPAWVVPFNTDSHGR